MPEQTNPQINPAYRILSSTHKEADGQDTVEEIIQCAQDGFIYTHVFGWGDRERYIVLTQIKLEGGRERAEELLKDAFEN